MYAKTSGGLVYFTWEPIKTATIRQSLYFSVHAKVAKSASHGLLAGMGTEPLLRLFDVYQNGNNKKKKLSPVTLTYRPSFFTLWKPVCSFSPTAVTFLFNSTENKKTNCF